ncbi:hypothetical protein Syun_019321 [Stephania yunnanensis]|uniref:Uncharacterized protein n=1 Tax=Stephania yunnanensis TaxID=152371 RepID=A0AAP0NX80_9MAGN
MVKFVEMRQALEARLVAAEEIKKVVEQEKLDKEESALRYFVEQQDLDGEGGSRVKATSLEAEENSKITIIMDPPMVDIELNQEKIEEAKEEEPLLCCHLFYLEVVHEMAQPRCSYPETYTFDHSVGLVATCTENYCVQLYSLSDDREVSQALERMGRVDEIINDLEYESLSLTDKSQRHDESFMDMCNRDGDRYGVLVFIS